MPGVLVLHASKRGGTAGIADMIAQRLEERGIDSEVRPASHAPSLHGYDAIVIGSALYTGRWQGSAVRALRKAARLDDRPPLWLFHSGPLGDDDGDEPQKAPRSVEKLTGRVGADVVTFGGRLTADTRGFIAKAMVRNGLGGDWRNEEHIVGYADAIADAVIGPDAA